MHCSLFVTNQDVFELVLLEQFVVYIENRAAGIAEHIFDFFLLQAPDYDFCAGKLH